MWIFVIILRQEEETVKFCHKYKEPSENQIIFDLKIIKNEKQNEKKERGEEFKKEGEKKIVITSNIIFK